MRNEKKWKEYVKLNKDPYGKCCVDVAREVMRLMDKASDNPIDANKLVSAADENLKAGITGYMAGAVASMVSVCHERGEMFRRSWNLKCQIGDEGERANEGGSGVLNPALLTINIPDKGADNAG